MLISYITFASYINKKESYIYLRKLPDENNIIGEVSRYCTLYIEETHYLGAGS